MKLLKSHKSFAGRTEFWNHASRFTKTEMKFATFIPEGKIAGALIWLSGLTCTEENFITKAGAQKYLAAKNLMVICPDTSPRGLNLPGEHDSYDFGSGASFYFDATVNGYADHYQMSSYVNVEIYDILKNEFKIEKISLFGHSMGGHGALVIGLNNPGKYASLSAFSPIVNPSGVPWGVKALNGYFGQDKSLWKRNDACELLKAGKTHPREILISQGTKDEFLEVHLLTENFVREAKLNNQKANVQYCEGYDHSYYFIATFIEAHINHHSFHLTGN